MEYDSVTTMWFAWVSIMAFWGFKRSTRELVDMVGINKKYYPQHYIATKGWMKKYFKIYQTMIPRYLYFRAYVTVLQALLFFLNTGVYYLSGYDARAFEILTIIQFTIIGVDIINVFIFCFRYRRKK